MSREFKFNLKKLFHILLWFVIILIFYVALIFSAYGLCRFVDNIQDKDNSNIVIFDDNIYNKSWVTDSQGNLVSQNLINVPNPSNLTYGNEPYEFSSVGISSGYYTLNFNLTNSSRATLSLYMMNSDNEEEEYTIDTLPYTFNSLFSQNVRLYIDNLEENVSYTLSNVMLVSGQNAITYEPFNATYYSSQNYNNSYNNGYNTGYSEGYNTGSSDNNNSYDTGYNTGYNTGYDEAENHFQPIIDNLNSSLIDLNSSYNSLLDQYNLLASQEYSFESLFWSLSSVPFGMLLSAFNVQVMGVNLRGIISGLFTAALLIWLFKKFFK